jgi:NodT family efflux transporter outer membrane factor (OMF) lipoprotein
MLESDTTEAKLYNWKEVFFSKNLTRLIDSALKNNFDLKIAIQKIELAHSGIQFNKGIRLPDLALNTSISQRKFGDYTMDGVGNYDTKFSENISDKQQIPNPLPDYYIGFQSSWEIDLWGKLKNKKKSAAAKFIASNYGRDLIITNLIAEISSTYFELLALDYEAKILIKNIKLQEDALELVKSEKEAGKANELSVELMAAQLLNSKTIQTEVKQLYSNAESKLNFLCGSFPGSIEKDTGYFNQQIQNNIESGIPSALLKNRPDIKQAEYELLSTNADVKSAEAAFYPSINLNTILGLQSFNSLLLLETPASLAYTFLGGISAPLLNRRKIKADLMASKAEQKIAYINYEKSIVNGFMEVYNCLNNIKNTNTMYNLKREEFIKLNEAIYTSTELFKAGKANYLEIITSQKSSLLAQIELLNLYKRKNMAIIDLYRSLGGGWK